jgi:hypothetical protein
MESNKNTPNTETYQEGYLPVQFFSSPAIPVTPDMKLEPRLGRPPRLTRDGQQGVKLPEPGPATSQED